MWDSLCQIFRFLGHFVMSLNRMSSKVMRLAFGGERFPSDAVQAVSPSPRVRRVTHYMAVMGIRIVSGKAQQCIYVSGIARQGPGRMHNSGRSVITNLCNPYCIIYVSPTYNGHLSLGLLRNISTGITNKRRYKM